MTQNLNKLKFIFLIPLLLLTSCRPTGNSYDQKWLLENELNENITIEAYYIPPPGSGFPAKTDQYQLKAKEVLFLHQGVVSAASHSIEGLAHFAFFRFFDVNAMDSLVLKFSNNKHLSFTPDQYNPLNPLNDSKNSTAWVTVDIGESEFESVFKLTQAHKDAAQ
tara:strand:+ start:2056 stop:2547 length:492 start_codon:yes stop_codon:yes gene_type:complete